MSLISLLPPACEPVSLREAKAYTRVDRDDDDHLLLHLIETARHVVENYTTRSLVTQRWRYSFHLQSGVSFSDHEYLLGRRTRGFRGIELPRSPFIRLVGLPQLVIDEDKRNIENYKLDTAGRTARLHFDSTLLDKYPHNALIQVDFEAGYGEEADAVPAPFKQAILMTVAELYDGPYGLNDNNPGGIVLSPHVIQLIRPYKVLRLS